MKSLEANPPPLFKSTVKLLILAGQTFDYNIAGIEVAREKTALIESYQRAGGGFREIPLELPFGEKHIMPKRWTLWASNLATS